MKTALPDCCLVVSSKEVHEETIYLCMVIADWTQYLSRFGTKELVAQVVHLGNAATSQLLTTSELLCLLK